MSKDESEEPKVALLLELGAPLKPVLKLAILDPFVLSQDLQLLDVFLLIGIPLFGRFNAVFVRLLKFFSLDGGLVELALPQIRTALELVRVDFLLREFGTGLFMRLLEVL